jgi:hypothetical protein
VPSSARAFAASTQGLPPALLTPRRPPPPQASKEEAAAAAAQVKGTVIPVVKEAPALEKVKITQELKVGGGLLQGGGGGGGGCLAGGCLGWQTTAGQREAALMVCVFAPPQRWRRYAGGFASWNMRRPRGCTGADARALAAAPPLDLAVGPPFHKPNRTSRRTPSSASSA